jgi:hypothetical protein
MKCSKVDELFCKLQSAEFIYIPTIESLELECSKDNMVQFIHGTNSYIPFINNNEA